MRCAAKRVLSSAEEASMIVPRGDIAVARRSSEAAASGVAADLEDAGDRSGLGPAANRRKDNKSAEFNSARAPTERMKLVSIIAASLVY